MAETTGDPIGSDDLPADRPPIPPDRPIIHEKFPFNPQMDAMELYESMRGLGTREKTIIDLLSDRTCAQRLKIAAAYKELYGKDITTAMKGELKIIFSGHFEDMILSLFKPQERFDAEQIHHAINLPISDEDMLITIMCSRNNSQIIDIKINYASIYGRDLASDISQHVHTSSYFKALMASVLMANRDEDQDIIPHDMEQLVIMVEQAKWDSRALYDAGPKRWATDQTFIPMFTSRCYSHLRIMFEELEKLTDMPVEKMIAKDIHGDVGKFLEYFAKFVKNKHKFFAEMLYKSMKGLGTNDRKLMHTVISRAEKDLGNVKDQFEDMYGKTLSSFIMGDTSGNYRHMLLALCGYPWETHHK